MIKILEVGKIFKARCPKCNCLFQYEKEDIRVEKLDNDEYSVAKKFQREAGWI